MTVNNQILKTFWHICLFRAGPQDIPYSKKLMIVCLSINFAIGVLGLSIVLLPTLALIISAFMLVITMGITRGLVLFYQVPERYVQTLTSLVGVALLLSILTSGIKMLISILVLQSTHLNWFYPAIYSTVVAGHLWLLATTAHIYHHAFNVRYTIAALLAVTVLLFVTLMIRFILIQGF